MWLPSPLGGEGQILKRQRSIRVRGRRRCGDDIRNRRLPLTLVSALRLKPVPLPQGERVKDFHHGRGDEAMGRTQSVPPAGLFDRMRHDSRRVETPDQYRDAVLLDLQDLLGTIRRWSNAELIEYQEVNQSVLNYGVSPITGRVVTRDSADALAREIRESILRFDQRFDPASFQVTATLDPDRTPLDALTLRLEGHLRGFPKPVPFYVRVAANLDNGLLELIPETAGHDATAA